MLNALPPVPAHEDAYRWIYADFAAGELSAVCIFMIGSLFSPRYAAKGAHPLRHCAVNFALYRGERRVAWALTEYPAIAVEKGRWRIGRSALALRDDGAITVAIDERGLRGEPVRAQLEVSPSAPPLRMLHLIETGTHTWQALAPRATATLRHGERTLHGIGYVDSNAGATKLGTNLARWSWSRAHGPEATEIRYEVDGGMRARLIVRDGGVEELPCSPLQRQRSGWGLSVPREVTFGERIVAAGPLVESSPFYARQHNVCGDVHVMSEAADFQRFRSPFVRWMADWRTRYEAVPA